MNIRRLYRRISQRLFIWRMHRQLPRPHIEIMRELDTAQKHHRRTAHIHQKLRESAHQGLRT